jgi:SAM-dependent methyltransferase
MTPQVSEPAEPGAPDGPGYLARQRTYWDERARKFGRGATGFIGSLRIVEVGAVAASLRGRKILDCGCGDGVVARWSRRLRPGVSISGIDLSERMIERARAGGIDAIVGNMLDLPWDDRNFTTSYAVRSLKNILDASDQVAAMHELARVTDQRIVVVETISDGFSGAMPEYNLFLSDAALRETFAAAGFVLRRKLALRDWYWLLTRRDRHANEQLYVFDRESKTPASE